MSRRSRPTTSTWALLAGASGLLANTALALFFALARPWGANPQSEWFWLGTLNDVTGGLSMLLLAPAALELARRVGAGKRLRLLTRAAVTLMAALAAASGLLVVGVLPLAGQFVVSAVAVPVLFLWMIAVSRRGRRAGVLGAATGRFGAAVGIGSLGATVAFGVGWVLPESAARTIVLGVAGTVGAASYFLFPIWPIALARTVFATPSTSLPDPRRLTRGPASVTR